MKEELKNCPFCNNKAECKISAEEQAFNVIVRCTNCGVSMSESLAKELSVGELQFTVDSLINTQDPKNQEVRKWYPYPYLLPIFPQHQKVPLQPSDY